ncbi:hypothetical protein, partial [Collinsella aerofaciens]|uniref:hypothetical protein n=1 Tax=Collinsella aerofaciens TaxID=74426 RepID=UPI003D78B62F
MDHFGPARLAEALVQGRPNKTMPVYYDEFDIPDHDCIFLNIESVLPALIIVLGGSGHCGGASTARDFRV